MYLEKFALLAGFLWYRCYYPHWSRDSLSPICGSIHFFMCKNLSITKFIFEEEILVNFSYLWLGMMGEHYYMFENSFIIDFIIEYELCVNFLLHYQVWIMGELFTLLLNMNRGWTLGGGDRQICTDSDRQIHTSIQCLSRPSGRAEWKFNFSH